MFFWRRVAPQAPEDGLKPTATPGYSRNFRELNDLVAAGKSFSGYEKNPLFLNTRRSRFAAHGHRFVEVGGLFGVDFDDDGRAVAASDWDRDGDIDLWVTNRNSPRLRLLRNDLAPAGRFLAVHLVGNGTSTNRDAVGARLTLRDESDLSGSPQSRTVRAGSGFLAQSSPWVHFGLGMARGNLTLEIAWPGGGTESFAGLQPNSRYEIRQGEGTPAVLPPAPVVEVATANTPGPGSGGAAPPAGLWAARRIPLPEVPFTGPGGDQRSVADLAGRPLLVNLWATWCAPCIEELGVFAREAGSFAGRGATVLALNVDGLAGVGGEGEAASGADADADADADEVLRQTGFRGASGSATPEALARIELVSEFLTGRAGPLPVPTSILVDASGHVAALYLGPVSWERLSDDLARLDQAPAQELARMAARPGTWASGPHGGDRAQVLGDYATLFARNGFPGEAQRLSQLANPTGENRTAPEHFNLAKAAAVQGEIDLAESHYRAAVALDPSYGPALAGLGAVLLGQKKTAEAEALFQRALEIDPNHAAALINLAMIERSRGETEPALARLRRVVALNPDYAEAHLNLGSLLASTGRRQEAVTHLERAVDLAPDQPVAHVNLATALLEGADFEKAETYFRSAIALDPDLAYAHARLGFLLARRGEHREAVTAFQHAISSGRPNPHTFTQLGESLAALGLTDKATEAFQIALRLDPEHPRAKEALAELTPEPRK